MGVAKRGLACPPCTPLPHESALVVADAHRYLLGQAPAMREAGPQHAMVGRALSAKATMSDLKDLIRAEARAAGFDVARITTPAALDTRSGHRLAEFLKAGRHGDMEWMASTSSRRRHPKEMWPAARTIVMLGMNYAPAADPLAVLGKPDRGAISCYAQGRDYHDVVRAGLKRVAGSLARASGADVKIFVDTAPLMEKPLAAAAGLGWQGKHTNLVSRRFGSWLFLGAILTTAELLPDPPESDHCGTCTRCLDVCPTRAFPAPYQLDARRCIAYLTIEHKGHIPRALRPAIGNRIYGCDDCLAVCPWNKFAQAGRETKLAARTALAAPQLADLARLDDRQFRALFAKTTIKRTGRDRFVRNVLIAIGNCADPALAPEAERLIADPAPLVRGAAIWALGRL